MWSPLIELYLACDLMSALSRAYRCYFCSDWFYSVRLFALLMLLTAAVWGRYLLATFIAVRIRKHVIQQTRLHFSTEIWEISKRFCNVNRKVRGGKEDWLTATFGAGPCTSCPDIDFSYSTGQRKVVTHIYLIAEISTQTSKAPLDSRSSLVCEQNPAADQLSSFAP